MSGKSFYPLVCGWLIGIAFGTSSIVSYSENPLFVIFSLVSVLLIAYFAKSLRVGTLLVSFFCILGFYYAYSTASHFDTISRSTNAVEREGVVTQVTPRDALRTRVIVHDKEFDVDIRAVLTENIPHVGDFVRYSATFKEPDAFITETGRIFNYREFSRARNVLFDTNDFTYELIGSDWYYSKIRALYSFKDGIAKTLAMQVREPEVGLAQAMLLGIEGTMNKVDEQVFREVGLVHVVVLSGFHIMAIFGVMIFLLSFFIPYRSRFIGALIVTILFSLMVGLTPTVMRAVIMATCVAGAYVLGRGRAPIRSLMIAAVIITFLSPYALLYDAGFQFSFLATFAIIVVSPIIELFLRAIPTTFGIRSIVAATISIEFILTPLMTWSIGTLSVVGILANMLVLPVVGFAMLSSLMLWLSTLLLPVLVPPLSVVVTMLHSYIITTAKRMHGLPYAYVEIGVYSLPMLCLIYLGSASVIMYLAWKRYGMPSKQKSALRGPDVSHYTIETIDDIRAKLDVSLQRPS